MWSLWCSQVTQAWFPAVLRAHIPCPMPPRWEGDHNRPPRMAGNWAYKPTSHLACRNLKSSVQLDSTSKVNLKGMDWKTYFPSYFSFWFFCNHCKVAPGNYNNPLMSLQASCTWLPVLAHTYIYIGNRKYNLSLKVSQSPHTCTWLILVYIIDKNELK